MKMMSHMLLHVLSRCHGDGGREGEREAAAAFVDTAAHRKRRRKMERRRRRGSDMCVLIMLSLLSPKWTPLPEEGEEGQCSNVNFIAQR